MEIVKFIYQDSEIGFDLDSNGMINATEMAKIYNKRVDVFLKSDHAQAFIGILEFPPNGGNSDAMKRDEIIQTKGQSGTWMCQHLALKFAAWLDPRFEVWVYQTIRKLIMGHYEDLKKATIEKITLKDKKETLRDELLKEDPRWYEYFKLEDEEKAADRKRAKASKAQLDQLQLQFGKRYK